MRDAMTPVLCTSKKGRGPKYFHMWNSELLRQGLLGVTIVLGGSTFTLGLMGSRRFKN